MGVLVSEVVWDKTDGGVLGNVIKVSGEMVVIVAIFTSSRPCVEGGRLRSRRVIN